MADTQDLNPCALKSVPVQVRGGAPNLKRAADGIGRHAGLRILCPKKAWGFESLAAHQYYRLLVQ